MNQRASVESVVEPRVKKRIIDIITLSIYLGYRIIDASMRAIALSSMKRCLVYFSFCCTGFVQLNRTFNSPGSFFISNSCSNLNFGQ